MLWHIVWFGFFFLLSEIFLKTGAAHHYVTNCSSPTLHQKAQTVSVKNFNESPDGNLLYKNSGECIHQQVTQGTNFPMDHTHDTNVHGAHNTRCPTALT
eukprot:m.186257 g.186257  ORF g.186257 m.186257 type:complete len:99 (+) comp14753_c0_seq1:535-831(+)